MFRLEYSWFFIFLPFPLIIHWLFSAQKKQSMSALQIPYFERLQGVLGQSTSLTTRPRWRWWLALLTWFLLVLSVANPVWLGDPIPMDRSGRALMLAVDLSGSMDTADMSWQGYSARRIDVVKKIAGDFLDQRKGDRLGLILFGSNAYLQAPLSFDRATVKTLLEESSIGLAGTQTAIGDAMALAVKYLTPTKDREKVLVLLTDGVNNAGHVQIKDVLNIAQSKHIRIYTIGLGANQIVQQGLFGSVQVAMPNDLDEKTLRAIADQTGGEFFRATSTQDLQNIYSKLNSLEPIVANQHFIQPKEPLYPWLLTIALMLGMLIIWPRGVSQRHLSSS